MPTAIAPLRTLVTHGVFAAVGRYDYDEYCHWTFPDDDPAQGVPSYMMARRLKPHSERTAFRKNASAKDASVIERSLPLLLESRPAVTPSPSRKVRKLLPLWTHRRLRRVDVRVAMCNCAHVCLFPWSH